MITVDEKTDGSQVWKNVEGDYTFEPLSTLHPGDKLEADHQRPNEIVLRPADLEDLATAGPDPTQIFVRVRSATPADRAKPSRGPGQGGGSGGGRGNPQTPAAGGRP